MIKLAGLIKNEQILLCDTESFIPFPSAGFYFDINGKLVIWNYP